MSENLINRQSASCGDIIALTSQGLHYFLCRLRTQVEEKNTHRCHHITKQFRLSFGMTIGIGWHAVETSRKSLKTRLAPFVRIWRIFRSTVARINSVGIYQPVQGFDAFAAISDSYSAAHLAPDFSLNAGAL